MNPSEKTLTDFETRVRQMILQFQELKKENGRLQDLLSEQAHEIDELKAKVAQAENDYNSLKMARMLEISDGNLEEAKERLAKMIRQGNKCIAILSTIALMTLIDIALMYERERGKNDTAPYDGILAKLTSEIEEALK